MEKFLLKEIQQSLVGNTGTQVFVRLQEQVTAAFVTNKVFPIAQTVALAEQLLDLSKQLMGKHTFHFLGG